MQFSRLFVNEHTFILGGYCFLDEHLYSKSTVNRKMKDRPKISVQCISFLEAIAIIPLLRLYAAE